MSRSGMDTVTREGSDVDIRVELSEVPGIFGFLEALNGTSPRSSADRWTWSKRVRSNPVSPAAS